MQTLGLSESTPRSESRIKSLFWPSIQSGADVDYLGAQGYWVCTVLGIFSLVITLLTNQALIGVLTFLLYYLGGVGVRERSRYAAAVVFLYSFIELLVSGVGVMRVLFTALLLSNLRATWVASGWKADAEQAALPPRLKETWADKFTDQLPAWLWPKVRIIYYIFSGFMVTLVVVGLAAVFMGQALR